MTQKLYYVAETYLHESLFRRLLKEHQSQALMHIQVINPNIFLSLNQKPTTNDALAFLETYRLLKQKQNDLVLYRSMVQYPAFIRQLCDFRVLMEKYSLNLDDLPLDTQNEQELKLILTWIQDLPLEIQTQNESIQKWLQFDLTHVFWNYTQSKDLYYEKIIQQFKEKQMNFISLKKTEPQSKHFYKALNMRQEIESVAQWIINYRLHVNEVQVILCDPKSYTPLIQNIFSRYKIPFVLTHQTQKSFIVTAFVSLIRLVQKPSVEKMLSAYQNKCFSTNLNHPYYQFIQTYYFDWTSLLKPIDFDVDKFDLIFNEFQRQTFLIQQKQANLIHETILPILEEISHWSKRSLSQQLEAIFRLLKQHSSLKDSAEMHCLQQIKTLLESISSSLITLDNPEFLIELVNQIKVNNSESVLNKVIVTDLTRPLDAHSSTFVLGCDQKNFPHYVKQEGIFDEDYLKKTPFPSHSRRYRHHLDQLDYIFHAGEHLYFSYAIGGYDGKANEASFEIEEFVQQKATLWPLLEENYYADTTHKLKAETAEALFFNERKLHGSISSFERYFQCPYAYFIERGLRIKKPFEIQMNQALTGTIQHALLDECTRRYEKNYATVSIHELRELAKPYFLQCSLLFPRQSHELSIMESRMIENLYSLFAFLKDMELNTSFVPYATEYHFSYTLPTDSKFEIALTGVIDRIDMNLDALRIIDYKSSSRTLSEKKVASGIQLQLLTYLEVAISLFDKTPMGAYYCSLKDETLSVEAAKLDLRKKECRQLNESHWLEQKQAAQRLNGWTFNDPEFLDYDANHIVGLKMKDHVSTLISTPYDYFEVQKLLNELMNELALRLSQGNIELNPCLNACTFCDYLALCHYHGIQKKITPLFEIETLKKEKVK